MEQQYGWSFATKKLFILKDCWIQHSHVQSEIEFLEKIKNDSKLKNCVPNIIEGQDVEVGGVVDSTGWYREFVGGMCESRIHHCIVMIPIGTPITTFDSKAEFICAQLLILLNVSNQISFMSPSDLVNISDRPAIPVSQDASPRY